MKKLIIFLITATFCVSCKTTYTTDNFLASNIISSIDLLDGNMYKVEFDNHTYILYIGHYRGGITHDPDCQCNKE